ncbi:hypothetical protein ULMS_03320 [Patiriisocius marinistellae]|uniref:Outer membrane protein beta-barrel domain-containing protein n=1 Tax=Patiriisocius marinistellae TaxID=2494560 RepID=A0A5J4FUV8_9FLAO|nr:outer membrane beta-barrel protein [Patiriisocius marinistellae]GEQ84824.1 hypothetical protein ULMS_03320 [Patiriisocius marinistellae]
MENKKNIDSLFKERFNQFEATPPPHVWENIQAQLQEKKKDRKVIPLWWKMGGLAAILALMFTIGSSVWDNTNNNNSIVNEDSKETKILKEDNNHSPLIDTDKQITEIHKEEEVVEETNFKTLKRVSPSSEISGDDAYSATQKTATTNSNSENNINSINKSVAAQTNQLKNQGVKEELIENAVSSTINNKKDEAFAIQNGDNLINKKGIQNSTVIDEKIAMKNASVEKDTSKKNDNPAFLKENEINISEEVIAQEMPLEEKEKNVEATKKSIFDAIDEQKKVNVEDAIVKKDPPKNRWEVAPNFAPVYYNTLSEGSSIDASFADNSQSGDVNFSYGVGISYAVNNRLSIRTGVSNVDLSYSTSGIELGNGPISAALRSVDYNNPQSVLIPQDAGTFEASNDGTFGEIRPKSTSGEVFLNQNISYYEVPLELKYALFNTKLGVNIIGGMSTLFLGNNEVSVTAGNFNETLGEANNLSNVSFSTNVGLGFDYKLSSKFKFNVEPMFKYQLNPYTDNTVNFKPYYIGVYTGLSFKF